MHTINTGERSRNIISILIKILILNWGVALAKIIYGFLTHCVSMAADGFHSLSDGASNIIGIVGIRVSSRPIDQDHPYGHKKYETFFSLGIAALLFLICFNLIKEGITRLYNPVMPKVDIKSFIVMLITMVINLIVMFYERKKGKLLKSDILVSDSVHTGADIITSFSVIIALVGMKLGYPIIDPIVTIIIALFIARVGYHIVQDASRVLCDTVAIEETKKIVDIVLAVKGVKACHKIRTRGRPDDIYIDLHVQVNPDMHVDDAHEICYAIEEAIKKAMPEVADVIVHIEPKENK